MPPRRALRFSFPAPRIASIPSAGPATPAQSARGFPGRPDGCEIHPRAAAAVVGPARASARAEQPRLAPGFRHTRPKILSVAKRPSRAVIMPHAPRCRATAAARKAGTLRNHRPQVLVPPPPFRTHPKCSKKRLWRKRKTATVVPKKAANPAARRAAASQTRICGSRCAGRFRR